MKNQDYIKPLNLELSGKIKRFLEDQKYYEALF
jgi:hypothetical protein